jgi:hypothetical protein
LVEVLISIGIVAIGLLGVVSLLPLGQHEARRGTIVDRAAAVGQAAFHHARIAGVLDGRNWAYSGNTIYNPNQALLGQANYPVPVAFAVDPTFASEALNNSSVFPLNAPAPNMPRFSLRAGPGSQLAMTRAQADELCVSRDDLQFELPSEQELQPIQKDMTGILWDVAPGDRTKRLADGHFCWMVTMVPQSTGATDLWTMSAVVFYQRRIPTAANRMDNYQIVDERVVRATVYGGFGGGDVTLITTNGAQAQNAESVLDVKQGDWLMLAQGNLFKWYRVIASDDPYQGGGAWSRDVTLAGPDWPSNITTASAFLVKGVIAVYEKTVRLETSSLWTY